jgi:hypothetical protein
MSLLLHQKRSKSMKYLIRYYLLLETTEFIITNHAIFYRWKRPSENTVYLATQTHCLLIRFVSLPSVIRRVARWNNLYYNGASCRPVSPEEVKLITTSSITVISMYIPKYVFSNFRFQLWNIAWFIILFIRGMFRLGDSVYVSVCLAVEHFIKIKIISIFQTGLKDRYEFLIWMFCCHNWTISFMCRSQYCDRENKISDGMAGRIQELQTHLSSRLRNLGKNSVVSVSSGYRNCYIDAWFL